MSLRVTSEHVIECIPAIYWDRCLLSDSFNRRLFVEELRYADYEAMPSSRIGGTRFLRRVHAEPGAHNVPSLVRSALAYDEVGELDTRTNEYRFSVRNVSMPDALRVSGSILARQVPYQPACRLSAVVDVEVKLFGLGGVLEERIAHELRRSFAISADLASAWTNGRPFVLRPELA